MAIDSCRQSIKDSLSGIAVNDLDKNEINESGIFLLYTGFKMEGGLLYRNFDLYVAGNSFDETLARTATLTDIEKKLTKKALPPRAALKVTEGKLIRFDDDGFYVFLIKVSYRDDEAWV